MMKAERQIEPGFFHQFMSVLSVHDVPENIEFPS